METLKETKKMYSEILKTLNKYKEICIFDIEELERKSKLHIYGVQLKEEFGLNINLNHINSLEYNQFEDYKTISWYGNKYNRRISWSVNGKQPKNELLFTLGFSTGAYIFGDYMNHDYPTEFFQKFWLELKTYKPDYIDEANKYLYWKIENAKEAFNSFDEILNKYHALNIEDIKLRKIKKLKEDLAKLENIKL